MNSGKEEGLTYRTSFLQYDALHCVIFCEPFSCKWVSDFGKKYSLNLLLLHRRGGNMQTFLPTSS
jgi:hypothetical protein